MDILSNLKFEILLIQVCTSPEFKILTILLYQRSIKKKLYQSSETLQTEL